MTKYKIKFTIQVKKLSDGYMASIKEMPFMSVYSKNKKHLMEKMFTCIAGYTLTLPYGDVPVELLD